MRANRTWFAPTPAMASTTRAYCTSASAGELQRSGKGKSPRKRSVTSACAGSRRTLHTERPAAFRQMPTSREARPPAERSGRPGRRRCSPSGLLAPAPVGLGVDAVLGELRLEVLPVYAEVLRGARDVALVALEHLADALPLEALDHLLLRLAEAAGPLAGLLGRRRPYCGRQVLEPDLGRRAEHDRLLDRMLELADVPLPLVSEQRPVRRGRERLRSAAEPGGGRAEEVLDQGRQVLGALAERREDDAHHVQPVVEVLTEGAGLHLGLEVLVGGGEHAHVDAERAVAAHALELALLEHAQDLGLGLERHVADLVEEEAAAVGHLELAFPRPDRAGEGALLVPEELALDQLPREGGAVPLDERLGAPGAVVVERIGHELLARAARPPDEDRQVGVGHLADHVEHALHGRALADHVLEAVRVRDLLLEQAEVAPERDALERAVDDQLELVVVERLWQVVGRP